MTDRVFKIGVLIIGVLFLILFYQLIQNNRFQMKDNTIFDTRTGIIYELKKDLGFWIKADPKSGKMKRIPFENDK